MDSREICRHCKGVGESDDGYLSFHADDKNPVVQKRRTCPVCDGNGYVDWTRNLIRRSKDGRDE